MLSPEDTLLVRQLSDGEAGARSAFYRRFHRDVLGWCRRLGGGRLDPEDAAHDVFVVALARIHSFRGESTLARWLFGLTRRVLANHRRKARTRQLRELLTGELPRTARGPERDPERELLGDERMRMVHRCLGRLRPQHREVLVLAAIEGRSGDEVAELLGIPRATVYTRLHYARVAFGRFARDAGLIEDDRRGGAGEGRRTRGDGGRR